MGFVGAILYFDLLLTGADLYKIKKTKRDCFIIENLINFKLKKQTNVLLPPFIIDCFSAFTQNKKQMIFNLGFLKKYVDKRMNGLIFHSLNERIYGKESKRKVADFRNSIRSEIFSVFPNVKTLIIQSTSNYVSYSFSLRALLYAISGTNLIEIIIKAQECNGYNWIKTMWESDEKILKKEYAAKKYEIGMEIKHTIKGISFDSITSVQYHLKINKMSQ